MSWIWWIIGTVGIGGALLGLAIIIFGWPVIIGTRIGRTLLAIGGGVLAVFGVYLKGRSEGAAGEKEKRAKATQKIKRTRDEIDDAVSGRSDDQNRDRLGRWVKKP